MDAEDEVVVQETVVEMIQDDGFVPERLSVERVSQLVGSDVASLNLQRVASNDVPSSEVEWTRSNIEL